MIGVYAEDAAQHRTGHIVWNERSRDPVVRDRAFCPPPGSADDVRFQTTKATHVTDEKCQCLM